MTAGIQPNTKKAAFRFTASAVDNLPLPSDHRTFKFWDDDNKDLCVITYRTGKRKYYLIKTINGQKHNVCLGSVDSMIPQEARNKAKSKETEIREGRHQSKKEQKISNDVKWARKATAGQLLAAYLKRKPYLAKNTVDEYERAVDNVVNPTIGEKTALMSVRRKQILDAVAGIRDRDGNTEAEAYRFVKTFRMLWDFTNTAYRDDCDKEVFGASPTGVLKETNSTPKQGRKEGVIFKSDLGKWWQAAIEFANKPDKRWHDRYKDSRLVQSVAARVFLLTGWRLEQLLSLEKAKVNYQDQFFIVDDEDTKNRDGRPMPLPTAVIPLLKSLDPINKDNQYVFYSSHSQSGYAAGIEGVIDHCSAAIGYRITAHDLRRTHATIGEALGFNTVTVKRLEGHKTKGHDVTADYMITYTDTFKRLADSIADFVDEHHKEYVNRRDNGLTLAQ